MDIFLLKVFFPNFNVVYGWFLRFRESVYLLHFALSILLSLPAMAHTYAKKEKLKSKKLIEALFIEGRSVKSFPLRLIYMETPLKEEGISHQVSVSVSKRNFKLAVSRNRIKRLMRESYRLHKDQICIKGTTFVMLIIYTGREEVSQQQLHKAMVKLIKRFNDAISTTT
ncbi:ribonuclease P [Dokdonia donghaensis DSW-1]|nr:ribonuclease P [Dokdonia donghaensis DSW-1]